LAADRTFSWKPATNSEPTGNITSPAENASETGNITVSADASDDDGLQKVSVVFVPNGAPLVLCEDGTLNPCSETSAAWKESGIDPTVYGVTEAGSITLGLWVRDDDEDTQLVTSRTFTWTPSVMKPEYSCDGPNYEQRMPIAGVRKPRITTLSAIMEGDAIIVTVDFLVDDLWKTLYEEKRDYAGKPFVRGCADSGQVECLSEDCRQFKIIGAENSDTVHVNVQVGDTLGYVAVFRLTLHPTKILTLKRSGNGTIFAGKETCGLDCAELRFPVMKATRMIIKPIPGANWRFVEWQDLNGNPIDLRELIAESGGTAIAVFEQR